MGVCGSSGSCSGSTGNTCDTVADRPQWVLLFVHANRERKLAEGLQAKGYEVFLPMHTVRRQWSDRVKTYDAPLFPGQLFCRFSSVLVAKRILAVTTPDVVLAKPMPIPDIEIERLRRITASQYPVECCALPQTGEVVEIPGDIAIRGVLVERDSVCRVAIGFDVMGYTVVLRVPLIDLERTEGTLTPHWSLRGRPEHWKHILYACSVSGVCILWCRVFARRNMGMRQQKTLRERIEGRIARRQAEVVLPHAE